MWGPAVGASLLAGALLLAGEVQPAGSLRQAAGRGFDTLPTGNLVKNGNAEAGVGAGNTTDVKPPPSWSTGVTSFTAVKYVDNSGTCATDCGAFLTASYAAANGLGKNFFAGGPGSVDSLAYQFIDVTAYKEQIDTGAVEYVLSADLGGQDNNEATVHVVFTGKKPDGTPSHIHTSPSIGPVTDKELVPAGTLVLLPREQIERVPIGTREIEIIMKAYRAGYPVPSDPHYDTAFLDNVSLSLHLGPPLPPPPPPQPSKTKKAFTAAGNGLKVVGGGATLVGVANLLAPEPVLTKGTAAVAGIVAGVCGVVSGTIGLVNYLVDPPDSRYRIVATPHPRRPPRVAVGHGVTIGVARATNALAANAGRMTAVVQALSTSLNRAGTAKTAGDAGARAMQIRAAAGYLRSTANLLDADLRLRRRLAVALRVAHARVSFDRATVLRAQQRVARGGLPATLRSLLQRSGLNAAAIGTLQRTIVHTPVRGGVDLIHILTDTRTSLAETQVATALLHRAASLH